MRMNKKKIVISLGYVLAMILAISAFCAALAVNDFIVSTFSLGAIILINVIYSFLDLKKYYLFLIFNVSFFVLLLGRYILRTMQGIKWWEAFDVDIEKNFLLIIAMALIFTSTFAFVVSVIFRDWSNGNIAERHVDPGMKRLIRIFSFWFLVFVLAFSYVVAIERVSFVWNNSYLELYTVTLNGLPQIFYKIQTVLPIAVAMFMMSMPLKKYRRFGLTLYIVYLILTLFSGVRGEFVVGLISVGIFLAVCHFRMPLERIITVRKVIVVSFAGIAMLSFLGAYNTLRNDIHTEKNFWENIVQFIDDQGTSASVIEYAIGYRDELPDTNESYSLGPLISKFRYGFFNDVFGGDALNCSEKMNNALYCNNLGATISYLVLGDGYFRGHGLGTQYLAEIFVDFDYAGVVTYSCLLGIVLILFARILLFGSWPLSSLVFVAVMSIVYLPRQSAIGWVLVPISLRYILPIILIWFTAWIISRRRIQRRRSNLRNREKSQTRRVLWTTNVIMPYPAERIGRKPSVFGGWLIGLMKQIVNRGDYKLAIAAVYDGSKIKRFNDGKIVYYLLPCKDDTKYNGDLEYYWSEVVADFQPDLIHLHGTELVHNLVLQNACPNEKYLVSLQGLLGPISKKYLAGLSKKEIRRNRTFRDRIKGGILKNQKNNKKRSFYEAEILKNATAIVGRTEWDHNESLKIAGNKPYYKCNEILRDAFYDQNWNIREVEPHSIYVSQAGYPVKGFHILLEALPKLVEKYPDLKVYVAGSNILDRSTFRKRLLYSGYAKILENKIKKYGLEKNIIFIGEKTEAEVLECMKKSNVFVQCSVIENSSNSLGEAMLIGMPCVASDVGGTADLLDVTRGEGLLYRFGDARTLAELISRVFDDFGLAAELGENAKKHAKIIYDRQKNTDTMLEIYKKVINS